MSVPDMSIIRTIKNLKSSFHHKKACQVVGAVLKIFCDNVKTIKLIGTLIKTVLVFL